MLLSSKNQRKTKSAQQSQNKVSKNLHLFDKFLPHVLCLNHDIQTVGFI